MSEYRLDPGRGVIAVTIVLTIVGADDDAELWVHDYTENLRFEADEGPVEATVLYRDPGWIRFDLRFRPAPLDDTRVITIKYDLLGGAPRSETFARAGPAYAVFCMLAHGHDGGEVAVEVPSSFDVTTSGDALTEVSQSGRIRLESGRIANTTHWFACLSGEDLTAYLREPIQGTTARSIMLESYPDDLVWRDAVRADLKGLLLRIEGVLGLPTPGHGAIRVREVPASELEGYGGTFTVTEQIVRIVEGFDDPGLVAHELAHVWFNDWTIGSTWLQEGHAEWVASRVAGYGCPSPSVQPSGFSALERWAYRPAEPTPAEEDLIDYQYAASCYIVSEVMTRAGTDGAQAIVAGLLEPRNPYGTDLPTPRLSTWKRWLDIVDEVGFDPSTVEELDFTQKLISEYGAGDDLPALVGRSMARARYHELLEQASDWTLPEFIRQDLSAWEFGAALTATRAIADARGAAERTAELLPEIDALNGPVKAKIEAATTTETLTETKDLAEIQAAAAEKVAVALEAVASEPELIARLGLLGVDPAEHAVPAVEAVARADGVEAERLARAMIDSRESSTPTGIVRALLGGALLLASWFRWRRSHAGRTNGNEALAG